MDELATAALALRCLDLTELGDTCGPAEVSRLLAAAQTPFGDLAAVCVWPQYVPQAREVLRHGAIRIATVINFPMGKENIIHAVEDAREALRDGADEIDLVIPYRALLRGDADQVTDMVSAVADVLPPRAYLKTILETGELAKPALIRQASDLAIAAGAHFLKTSTGKTAVSATPEAARIMAQAIRDSGKPVGLKVSGGIRTLADAATYIGIARDVLGADWVSPQHFRIGASGLLTALLAALSTDQD